jgi:hypothetical protein
VESGPNEVDHRNNEKGKKDFTFLDQDNLYSGLVVLAVRNFFEAKDLEEQRRVLFCASFCESGRSGSYWSALVQ